MPPTIIEQSKANDTGTSHHLVESMKHCYYNVQCIYTSLNILRRVAKILLFAFIFLSSCSYTYGDGDATSVAFLACPSATRSCKDNRYIYRRRSQSAQISHPCSNAWINARPKSVMFTHSYTDTSSGLTSSYNKHESENNEWQWEDSMRQMATEALIPVFYSKAMSSDGNSSMQKGMDPEKALKKLLRRYQQSIASENENTTLEERNAARKRLADLVLGTSVMRIRHYHSLRVSTSSSSTAEIEPILGLNELITTSRSSELGNEVNKIKTVRAMVDLHAEYMTQRDDDDSESDTIMNCESTNDSERVSILYSLPRFFVDMLVEQYGIGATEEMAAIFNKSGPITIRRNRIKCPSDSLLCERLWSEDSVKAVTLCQDSFGMQSSAAPLEGCIRLHVDDSWSPSKKSIWSMQAWKDGWFEVQDAGSQLIVEATEAKCGEIVVDYCAGNGGKTFALASQMYQAEGGEHGIRSRIVAHDIVEERLRQLQGGFDRVGLACSSDTVVVKTTLDSGIELDKDMADVVLVDAPCSSTGVLRRRPSQRFQLKKEELVNNFPCLQLNILSEASELVKVGGRLVYATCSISEYENENVVREFERHGNFDEKWEPWDFNDNDSSSPGSKGEEGTVEGTKHCRALLPGVHDSDGFFLARWKRIR